jgi:hypothetical protein
MSQQIQTSSRLRRSFLVIGIVLLILSFFFFYWASNVNWNIVTTENDKVYLYNSRVLGLGDSYPFGYPFYSAIVQPYDVIMVSYPEPTHSNGTIHITLTYGPTFIGTPTNVATATDTNFLSYTNPPPNDLHVVEYLLAQNEQDLTLNITTTVHHYETSQSLQWVYFGIGVVLSSLAAIPIFKSKT